jgi:xyloglucan-specific endo-beta-1,4-glucanase
LDCWYVARPPRLRSSAPTRNTAKSLREIISCKTTSGICPLVPVDGNRSAPAAAQWWWPAGSGGVKAYPSIVSGWQFGAWSPNNNGFPVQVSANAPLPTSVSFYMSGNNQFDAAYDLFFSPNTNPSSPSAELMVWLNYSGNQPAGKPVAHGVALGGVGGTWDVWVGSVGWPVWSFVADSQTTSFSGNLQPFVYYVSRTNDWLNQSWYELNTEFGAEVLQSNGQNGGINVTNFSAAAY